MNKRIIILFMLSMLLLSACNSWKNKDIKAEERLERSIEAHKDLENYFNKSLVETYHKNKLIDESITSEWEILDKEGIKRKTEIDAKKIGKRTTLLKDGNLKVYVEDEKTLYNYGNIKDIDPSLDKSLIDRFINILTDIKDMPLIESLEYEEIDDRSIYRIKGSYGDKDDHISSVVEIDKESFLVKRATLKTKSTKVIIINEEMKPLDEIDSEIFKLDLPSDVKEEDSDGREKHEDISLDEVYEKLANNLLIIKNEDYELESIKENISPDVTLPRQYTLEYSKDNKKAFEINIIKSDIEQDLLTDESLGFEEVEIRGNTGYILDDLIQMVIFEEENHYIFSIDDPQISTDEIIELIENMERYN